MRTSTFMTGTDGVLRVFPGRLKGLLVPYKGIAMAPVTGESKGVGSSYLSVWVTSKANVL